MRRMVLAGTHVSNFDIAGCKKTGQTRHDTLGKGRPDVHKERMLKPFFRQGEFCAACHKVSLDVPVNGYRWFRGFNDYDN